MKMTEPTDPARALVEAVLKAHAEQPYVCVNPIDHILTTPAVQDALAKVRGQSVGMGAVPKLSSGGIAAPKGGQVFNTGAAIPITTGEFFTTSVGFATPKPEPVLRYDAMAYAKSIVEAVEQGCTYEVKVLAVRDWLKRAGCV